MEVVELLIVVEEVKCTTVVLDTTNPWMRTRRLNLFIELGFGKCGAEFSMQYLSFFSLLGEIMQYL